MKQNKGLRLALVLALCASMVLSMAGCSGGGNSSSGAPSGQGSSSQTNPAPQDGDGWQELPDPNAQGTAGELQAIYTPKYAKGFTVEYYYGGAKVIATDIKATSNTEAFAQRVLLLPEGAVEPANITYDHKIEGELERVITFASSHAGFFSMLEATDRIKGTSIKEASCFIPALKTALQEGSAQYVGSGKNADKELMASLQPQLVTIGGMASDTEVAAKLEESGIFCLYFGDFAEDNYLGRAEWISLVGALCGKEQEAQDIMKDNELAAQNVIERAAKVEEKPTVLWFVHSSQAPHWNVRTTYDYVNSMVSDLGGKMLFPEGITSNSVKLSNEDFLPLMLEADKIVFGISLNSYAEAKDITFFNKEGQIDFSQAKAFQNDDCYVVGYDWAQDTADVRSIMESLAIALYPDEFSDLENSGKIMKFKVQ